jgi:prepilin-type N-terminal cleavage/methylation domain-containing protein
MKIESSSRRGLKREGYSLVEVMLVVAIVGALAMVGPRLLIQLQNFYILTTARNEIQRDARTVLDIVNRFVRQAKWRTIIIDTPSGQGAYSRIRFTHQDGRTFSYYQEGNKFFQSVDGSTTMLADNLVYLAFTFPRSDYPRLVSVSMTMGKDIYRGQQKELELTIQKIRVMN